MDTDTNSRRAGDAVVIIDYLCGNCPVQAAGWINGQVFDFKSRGARWSVNVGGYDASGEPKWRYEEPHGTWPDAGYISDAEATTFIRQAANRFHADQISKGGL